MNEGYIKKLIRLVEESTIDSLEVSTWGRKVKIVRANGASNGQGPQATVVQPVAAPSPPPQPVAPSPETRPEPTDRPATAPEEETDKLVPVKSPMVGTFYTAPAPDADPYVALNQKITVGQVVCIVEAMKLMNEIESEVNGRVARVMVENAQPVEFGQTLFLIEPD